MGGAAARLEKSSQTQFNDEGNGDFDLENPFLGSTQSGIYEKEKSSKIQSTDVEDFEMNGMDGSDNNPLGTTDWQAVSSRNKCKVIIKINKDHQQNIKNIVEEARKVVALQGYSSTGSRVTLFLDNEQEKDQLLQWNQERQLSMMDPAVHSNGQTVILRGIPSVVTEEELLKTMGDPEVEDLYFIPGKVNLKTAVCVLKTEGLAKRILLKRQVFIRSCAVRMEAVMEGPKEGTEPFMGTVSNLPLGTTDIKLKELAKIVKATSWHVFRNERGNLRRRAQFCFSSKEDLEDAIASKYMIQGNKLIWQTAGSEKKCYCCGSKDHLIKGCPESTPLKRTTNATRVEARKQVNYGDLHGTADHRQRPQSAYPRSGPNSRRSYMMAAREALQPSAGAVQVETETNKRIKELTESVTSLSQTVTMLATQFQKQQETIMMMAQKFTEGQKEHQRVIEELASATNIALTRVRESIVEMEARMEEFEDRPMRTKGQEEKKSKTLVKLKERLEKGGTASGASARIP